MPSTKLPPTGLVGLILESCDQKRMLQPLKTRLVKLMYLVELEYVRRKRERLTDLDWKFHLYGPYPPSVSKIIGSPEVDAIGVDIREKVASQVAFPDGLDHALLRTLVNDVVETWGDADLNQLLDYVYFDTEPMQSAKRGEHLDFSTVSSMQTSKIKILINQEKLRTLREKISERAAAYGSMRQACEAPKDLVENLKIWDDENNQVFPSGQCRILVDDLRDDE